VCGNPWDAAITEHLKQFEAAGNAFACRKAEPDSIPLRLLGRAEAGPLTSEVAGT
jgi:hypothetical protein